MLVMLGFISPSTWAWDNDYVLPTLSSQTYPIISSVPNFFSVTYSSQSTSSPMPITSIKQGKSLRIAILVPPGVTAVSIGAESNQWQGVGSSSGGYVAGTYPVMGSFSTDPGELCTSTRQVDSAGNEMCGNVTGNFIYTSELHAAAGGLSDSLYGAPGSTSTVLTTPRYMYFVLYHPVNALDSFKFASLTISFVVSDLTLYSAWRSARPWAGGSSTSLDGIGETEPEPEPNNLTLILNHPFRLTTDAEINLTGAYTNTSGSKITLKSGDQISSGSAVTLSADILADTQDTSGDIVIVAAWGDASMNSDLTKMIWKQKVSYGSFFGDNSTGKIEAWQDWEGLVTDPEVANIVAYQNNASLSATTKKTITIGTGSLIPPSSLGTKRQVIFFVGYRGRVLISSEQGFGYFYVLNDPFILNIQD
ncbi:hypothetical protein [Beggiatoa alba]|nr:hypothetical protein [Beggiatoa alba]